MGQRNPFHCSPRYEVRVKEANQQLKNIVDELIRVSEAARACGESPQDDPRVRRLVRIIAAMGDESSPT